MIYSHDGLIDFPNEQLRDRTCRRSAYDIEPLPLFGILMSGDIPPCDVMPMGITNSYNRTGWILGHFCHQYQPTILIFNKMAEAEREQVIQKRYAVYAILQARGEGDKDDFFFLRTEMY
jgi:hypothetical protein